MNKLRVYYLLRHCGILLVEPLAQNLQKALRRCSDARYTIYSDNECR